MSGIKGSEMTTLSVVGGRAQYNGLGTFEQDNTIWCIPGQGTGNLTAQSAGG
jgi:hypothetical protein